MKINLKFILLIFILCSRTTVDSMEREQIHTIKKTLEFAGSCVFLGAAAYQLFYKPYYPPKQAALEFTKTLTKWYGLGSTALGGFVVGSCLYKGIYPGKHFFYSTALIVSGLGSLALNTYLKHKKRPNRSYWDWSNSFHSPYYSMIDRVNDGLGDCIEYTDRSEEAIEKLKQGIIEKKLDPSFKYYQNLELLDRILGNIEFNATKKQNMMTANKDFVKFLIAHGARVNKYQIDKILKEESNAVDKASGNYIDAGFGNYLLQIFTPEEILFKLAEGKIFMSQETVRQCLAVGIDLEAKDAMGRTPLIAALQNESFDVALAFIKAGSNVLNYSLNDLLYSPLALVKDRGNLEEFIKKKTCIFAIFALRKHDLLPEEIVQYIVSFIGTGFKPSPRRFQSMLGEEPKKEIYDALSIGKLILDTYLRDGEITRAHIIKRASMGDGGFGDYLIKFFGPRKVLFKLAEGKIYTSLKTVQECLKAGIDLEAKDASGRTPLIAALQNESSDLTFAFDTALAFIKAGASVLDYEHNGNYFSALSLLEGKKQPALELIIKKRTRVTAEWMLRKTNGLHEELVQYIGSFIGPEFRPATEKNDFGAIS